MNTRPNVHLHPTLLVDAPASSPAVRSAIPRNLTIEGDEFRLGGEPFRLMGGAIHYPRVPRAAWRDRLEKLIDIGCNTVETYVFWNAHEPYEGQFRFDGNLDVVAFVELAHSLGLHAIVRPGPYVCAEWDMGGLPWWLLRDPAMNLRCDDERFVGPVRRWFHELLPRLAPLQTTQGGPILAMQIENEYGYFGSDPAYLRKLKQIIRENGIDVPLFTSDGTFDEMTIAAGGLDDGTTLRTANFGSRAVDRLPILRKHQPTGPLVCMEYWVGWFDEWRTGKHATRDATDCATELNDLLSRDVHAVIYMFHGGTNFGFTAGGNLSDSFQPFVTSYDYDALLSEAGDVTPKYEACRDVIHRQLDLDRPKKKFAKARSADYGELILSESASLNDALCAFGPAVSSATPRSMEDLGHGRGFVLYRHTVPATYRGQRLVIRGMHDWCHVRLDGRTLATWYRRDEMPEMKLDFAGATGKLEILVHNLARSNFGHRMAERKGITEGVYVGPKRHDERALFGWDNTSLPLETLPAHLQFRAGSAPTGPAFFRGTLTITGVPADTYLELPDCDLGAAYVNGTNIGRYWNVGPQQRLYVPASFLREGANEIVVFDAVGVKQTPRARFLNEPRLA